MLYAQDIYCSSTGLFGHVKASFLVFWCRGAVRSVYSRGQTAVSYMCTYVEYLTITRNDDGAVRGRGGAYIRGGAGPLVVLFLRKSIAHHAALLYSVGYDTD